MLSLKMKTVAERGKCFVCGKSVKLHIHQNCGSQLPREAKPAQRIRKTYLNSFTRIT